MVNLIMQIKYFKTLNSTQTHLQEYIKNNKYIKPLCFVTQNQTNGQGSRDNSWIGKDGNLFLSFVLEMNLLPLDLPIQSASIYFSYILKDIFSKLDSKVLLKWPNDFYIQNKKLGGTITKLNNNLMYCGIGINLIEVSSFFGYLDININIEDILDKYFQALEQYPSWKQIISKFEIEFYHNNEFKTQNILLKETTLQSDGSLLINGEKVFSLR
jgi:BirA family biotin operon repressor/biotin-[acetyl-CoA-carboxylase] ligase